MDYEMQKKSVETTQENKNIYISLSLAFLWKEHILQFIKLKLEIFYFQNFTKLQIIMSRT